MYKWARRAARIILSNSLDCPVSLSIVVTDTDITGVSITLSNASTYLKKLPPLSRCLFSY